MWSMAHECFCGCGRRLRFVHARQSKLGGRVLRRVDDLFGAYPQFGGKAVGVVEEYLARGDALLLHWQALSHGDRLITGQDRSATAKWEEECDVLLKIVSKHPDRVGAQATVQQLRDALAAGSRLPFTSPMYENPPKRSSGPFRRFD
jgi:hypothetical protein